MQSRARGPCQFLGDPRGRTASAVVLFSCRWDLDKRSSRALSWPGGRSLCSLPGPDSPRAGLSPSGGTSHEPLTRSKGSPRTRAQLLRMDIYNSPHQWPVAWENCSQKQDLTSQKGQRDQAMLCWGEHSLALETTNYWGEVLLPPLNVKCFS